MFCAWEMYWTVWKVNAFWVSYADICMLALPQTVTDEIAGFVVKLPLQGHLFSQQTLKWSHKCHPLNQLAYPKKQFVHDNTSILSVHSKYLSSEWQKWIKIVMVLLYLKLWRVWGNCIVPSTNKIQNSTKFSVYCDICSNLQIIVGGVRSKVFKAINIPYFTRY